MSTEIMRVVTKNKKLVVTRYCSSASNDPIRMQLLIYDDFEKYQTISIDRLQWAQLSWSINKAFEEFPET